MRTYDMYSWPAMEASLTLVATYYREGLSNNVSLLLENQNIQKAVKAIWTYPARNEAKVYAIAIGETTRYMVVSTFADTPFMPVTTVYWADYIDLIEEACLARTSVLANRTAYGVFAREEGLAYCFVSTILGAMGLYVGWKMFQSEIEYFESSHYFGMLLVLTVLLMAGGLLFFPLLKGYWRRWQLKRGLRTITMIRTAARTAPAT